MIVDKYIRYYYNIHGNFDKTMRYYDIIEKRAKFEGMSTDAYLYSRLGYSHSVDLPANAIAKIRYTAARKDVAKLYDTFNISTKKELNTILETIGAMPDYIRKTKKENQVLDDVASCIANYMRNVTHVKLTSGVSLAQYILMLRHVTDNEELQTLTESPAFMQLVKLAMPKLAIRRDCSPYVTGGTCFVPYKLSTKDLKYISIAIRKYLIRPMYLSKSELMFCNNAALNIMELYEIDPYSYLKLIDIANAQDITVNELVNSLGYRIPNIDKQLEEDKIFYYLSGKDTVKVFNMNSLKLNNFIELKFAEFRELYEKDVLRFLDWDDEGNVVVLNEQQARIFNNAMSISVDTNENLVNSINTKQLELINSFGG